jgi:hypothetical protein
MKQVKELTSYQNLPEALLDEDGYMTPIGAFGVVVPNSPHVVARRNIPDDENSDADAEEPSPYYTSWIPPNETRPLPDYIEASPYTAGMPSLMSHAENKAYQEAKQTTNPLPSTIPAPITYDRQDGTQTLYFTAGRREPKGQSPYENMVDETGI